MYRKTVTCDKCDGAGFICHSKSEVNEKGYGWGSIWSEVCKECNGKGSIQAPMTNADHIRAMSDEELAEFIHNTYFNGYEDGVFEEPYVIRDKSFMEDIDKINEWLEKHVKDYYNE